MARATARGAAALARVLRTLHVALTLLQANPANAAAALIARLADTFDLGLSNLFLVEDPKLAVLLNYGAAALVWVLITAVVTRLVSRIG